MCTRAYECVRVSMSASQSISAQTKAFSMCELTVRDRRMWRALRIRGGTSVAVFPEGTRSREGTVGRFKRGSFLLALEAGVPVVPVSLCGVKRVAPGGLRVRGGRVRLLVHPPVATAGRGTEQAGALAEEVRRIVMTACEAA